MYKAPRDAGPYFLPITKPHLPKKCPFLKQKGA